MLSGKITISPWPKLGCCSVIWMSCGKSLLKEEPCSHSILFLNKPKSSLNFEDFRYPSIIPVQELTIMEEVVQQLSGNPLLLVLLGLLVFILAFLFAQSAEIFLFLAALVILYFGYVYFLQDKYPIPQVDTQTLTEWGTKIEEMIPDDLGAKFLDSNYTRPKEQP